MHYVINLSAEQELRIRGLVDRGCARNIYEFMSIAIDNQLELESVGGTESHGRAAVVREEPEATESREIDDTEKLLALPSFRPPVFQPLESPGAKDHFLWGQYYRFLPVKVVLRVLANLSRSGPAKYADFVTIASQVAVKVGERLRIADEASDRTEGMSSAFPIREDPSIERFRQQYIANYRPGRQISGFPVELGLETVLDEKGNVLVGLTRAGAMLALQQNPVLDANSIDRPLDAQEQLFLIEHIRRSLPREFEIMHSVLSAIQQGVNTPNELDKAVRAFYGEEAARWTSGHLTTMRAGLVSRMCELGLLSREWSGRRVKYNLTVDGVALLAGQDSKFTDAYKAVFEAYEVIK